MQYIRNTTFGDGGCEDTFGVLIDWPPVHDSGMLMAQRRCGFGGSRFGLQVSASRHPTSPVSPEIVPLPGARALATGVAFALGRMGGSPGPRPRWDRARSEKSAEWLSLPARRTLQLSLEVTFFCYLFYGADCVLASIFGFPSLDRENFRVPAIFRS